MANCSLEKRFLWQNAVKVLWNETSERVRIPYLTASCSVAIRGVFQESGCLGMQPKMGGKFHLKLNIGTRPIANKYCEGKMKSTLKRELKAREIVKREPIEGSSASLVISRLSGGSGPVTAQACRCGGRRCGRCTCRGERVNISLPGRRRGRGR